MILLFLLFLVVHPTFSDFCDFLPEYRKGFCRQHMAWKNASEKIKPKLGKQHFLTTGKISFMAGSDNCKTIYECMDIACICRFVKGTFDGTNCLLSDGCVYRKVERKELRMLSDNELQLYSQAISAVKNGIMQTIAIAHSSVYKSPGAHVGPSFIVWHREMLKRMEIGIRTTSLDGKYPFVNLGLPYWDATRDYDVYQLFNQSASNSVLFSSELMGATIHGTLLDGMFANFSGAFGPTVRNLDKYYRQNFLLKSDSINRIVNYNNVDEMFSSFGKKLPNCPDAYSFQYSLEMQHSDPHVWIGGNMLNLSASANDPIFFNHHSFMDYIFEQWRQKKQTRQERESQWSRADPSCYPPAHALNSAMIPFASHINQDGLSNKYTDFLYSYMDIPQCDQTTPCPSKFYFCVYSWN